MKNIRLLGYLVILNSLFLFWQLFYVLIANQNAHLLIFGIIFGHHHIHIPLSVLPEDLIFFAIQIALYVSLAIFIWLLAIWIGHLRRFSLDAIDRLGFGLWGLCVLGILLANQIHYPASIFYPLIHQIVGNGTARVALAFIECVLVLAVILAAAGLVQLIKPIRRVWWAVLIVLVFFLDLFFYYRQSSPVFATHSSAKPNIFIIGLDAVRPDFIGDENPRRLRLTPNLDRFLRQSVNFKTSITPLARTFPAWASILTGQYPRHHGARFDLSDQSSLHLSDTLPSMLKRLGYQTFFATDERRFSNIEKNFGFDAIIGPKEGANDFLLGSINDLPLSNILLFTRLGEWLFPYSFANRASAGTYRPETFIRLIDQQLRKMNVNKPLFFSVHFCLTHWPYTWANQENGVPLTHFKAYQFALRAVDQQFASLWNILRQRGLLQNAIVVIISDHGEAFGLKGDRMIRTQTFIRGAHSDPHIFQQLKPLTPLNKKKFPLDTSVGHGTDILSFTQFHHVLVFRRFGIHPFLPHRVDGFASLIDIKPTILNIVRYRKSRNDDGISLLPELRQVGKNVPPRTILTETDFSPTAINDTRFSVQDAVYESIDLFRIDPKTHCVVLKKSVIPHLLKLKQFGVYDGDWFLASYPKNAHERFFVLVNRKTGRWTDDLQSPFAKKAPWKVMMKELLSNMET